jgi:mannosyltransferase
VVPPALLLTASAVKPLYVDRYVLYAQAGLALLVGAALDTMWRTARARTAVLLATAAALLVPVATHLRSPQSRTDDATAIARAVREATAPGDGVLFVPASRRVWTLRDASASYGVSDLALAAPPHASHTLYGTELPPAGIRSGMSRVSRIVVVREPARERHETNEREKTKEATLRDRFTRCDRRAVGPARIDVYVRGDRC